MGTMIALLLVLGTLCGCSSETLLNVKNALSDPPAPSLDYVVELNEWSDSVEDSGGKILAECDYQVPLMKVLDAEGKALSQGRSPSEVQALKVAEAFNAQFDRWRNGGGALEEMAEDAFAFREASGYAPTMTEDLDCTVYQTDRFVSVSGTYYGYSGGAHGNTLLLSWNFDLETGTFFDAQILGRETDLQEAVYSELLLQAKAAAAEADTSPELYFWDDYAEILAEWSSYAVSFDETGMTVSFSPYELACYAAGPQTFHLSYDVLRPHLGREARLFLGLDS